VQKLLDPPFLSTYLVCLCLVLAGEVIKSVINKKQQQKLPLELNPAKPWHTMNVCIISAVLVTWHGLYIAVISKSSFLLWCPVYK